MLKILAVDDDLYILELYKALFLGEGFLVETAEDTLGALVKYHEFKPDLMILDVDMPAGGGQKVFERLRNVFESRIPVIFSTGLPESVAHLAKSASVAILKKPVMNEKLLSEVKRLLGIG
ncbi:MAG: hypothetical protein A2081_01175 [Elusimicrobia bacterium GWC2_61_19]|nr:MAG: hypothetical protein A2081_01175 [Elusimicrobia bacterium GWC2_61_19]HBB67409.1 two-component system response regulator [Elusimicrobiota bacterium]